MQSLEKTSKSRRRRSTYSCLVLVNLARSVHSFAAAGNACIRADRLVVGPQSTILKQMKLMYDGEYNDHERAAFKEIIFNNTVQCMAVVVQALDTLGLGLLPQNRQLASTILDVDSRQLEGDSLPQPLVSALLTLWRDPAVVEAVSRSKEFQLNDSAT